MFAEESPKSSGRRSKIEITCDILNVISKGNEKPTRIMQLANVTWDDLVMYLEALIRNQLVTRSVEGKRVTYMLTSSGSSLLGHYLKLKKEAAPLKLDTLTKEHITKAMTYLPTIGAQESDIYAKLERRTRGEGAKVLGPKIVGKSGAVHTLGMVAQRADGSKHGYVVLKDVDETQIMKLFVTQLDTEISIHALYSGDLSPKVTELARAYSLELMPWDDSEPRQPKAAPPPKVDARKFAGKALLLVVDPSMSYESIVKEFARAFEAQGSAVAAFTWKGGPIYSALSSMEGVKIFSMSSQTSYPKPTGRKNETAVPQDDTAVLLDVTSKILEQEGSRGSLVIFDSISDMVLSLGFEKSYGFLKAEKEVLSRDPETTALFIAKKGAQDEKVMSLVKGLYALHLSFDSSGLVVTRET